MQAAMVFGASGSGRLARRPLIVAAGAAAVLLALVLASVLILPPSQVLGESELPARLTTWREPAVDGQPARPLAGERLGRIHQLPWGQRSVLVSVPVPAPARTGAHVLVLPAAAGDPTVFINGVEAPAAPAGPRYLSLPGFRPMTAAIPGHFFRPGANRIDVVLTGARGRVLVAPLVLQSEARFSPALSRLTAWLRLAHGFSAPLSLLAALFALSAMVSAPSRTWFLALAAAAAAAGCRTALAGTTLSVDLEAWRPVIDRLLLGSAVLSLICAGLNRPSPSLPTHGAAAFAAWGAAGMLGALFVVTASIALWTALEPFSGLWVLWLEVIYGLGLAMLSAALILVSAVTTGRVLVRLAVEKLDLSQQVRRQRVQIEAAAQALNREMRRSAILEERQRLARDVHDGLGGSLTSLIARVRTRRIDIDQIEHELMGGLADLRLVVDSLDAVGESLSSALGMFRARIAPQLEAAGLTLTWDQSEDLGDQAEDPRWTLHLYRLLQEAVTNAARHSKGQRLSVVIRRLSTRGLRIEVSDDGIGLDPDQNTAGRGLGNMAYRAGQLGAVLRFERADGSSGTRVVIEIPDDRPDWEDDD